MGSRSPGIEKLNAIPPFWRLVVSLLVAVGMLGVWLFAFVHNWLVSGEDLPVALHSPLSADYSPDAVFVIPAARLNLLRDALSDEVRAGNDSPADQLATVVEQMRTPVFTVTPFPGSTSTLGGQPTQTQNQQTQEAPQETRAAPSSTSTVPTPTVTTTLTSLPTFFQPTATSYPATQTARPTNPPVVAMPTKTQTNTQVIPPSATSAPSPTMNPPTNTPVPPTSTHVPPTNTPVPQEPTDDYPPPPPPLPTNYP